MKTIDYRLKILIAAAAVLIIGGIVVGLASTKSESAVDKGANQGEPRLSVNESRFDFGDVSMAEGKVSHSLNVKNEGSDDLAISSIFTSCMCTSAVLSVEGKKSPVFGMLGHGVNYPFWSEKLKPGEQAELAVTFDPNAHGPNATGPITRTITLLSNDGGRSNSQTELVITANVIK